MFPDCGNFDENFMLRLSGKIEKLAMYVDSSDNQEN